MKKIVSALLVCVLLVGTLFTFASCTIVHGTYKNGATVIEFTAFGKVTITDEVEILGAVVSKTYEAKYSIEENDDGELQITFTYEEGADEHLVCSGTRTFVKGEENGKEYVKIGLITYEKE